MNLTRAQTGGNHQETGSIAALHLQQLLVSIVIPVALDGQSQLIIIIITIIK